MFHKILACCKLIEATLRRLLLQLSNKWINTLTSTSKWLPRLMNLLVAQQSSFYARDTSCLPPCAHKTHTHTLTCNCSYWCDWECLQMVVKFNVEEQAIFSSKRCPRLNSLNCRTHNINNKGLTGSSWMELPISAPVRSFPMVAQGWEEAAQLSNFTDCWAVLKEPPPHPSLFKAI